MKKIIFFDIDGTIVTEDGKSYIPESTVEAISLARQNGCYTYINTGRTICNIEKRLRDIGFDGYICGCGTYIEHQGEEIFYHKTSPEICRLVQSTIEKCGAIPVYEYKDALFYDERYEDDTRITSFKYEFMSKNLPFLKISENKDFIFDKFVIWADENTDRKMFESVVSEHYSIIDRGNNFYENVPLGFSKATAIYKILDILGIDIQNAYAIGDSMNDLPMLQAVPNSIAMGQGKAVHNYVSYVTTDIEDNGIWNALKHFNII